VNRIIKAVVLTTVALVALTSCTTGTKEENDRKEQQKTTAAKGVTQEQKNLEAKRKAEENPNAVGYLYVLSFGKPLGYYVTKGKISNSGSQAAPEQEIVWTCRHGDCTPVVVDSAQDDGSYGDGDPGIFFFTTDGTRIETDLDYMYSTQPIAFGELVVPKLK
jgi:hypothetical protein